MLWPILLSALIGPLALGLCHCFLDLLPVLRNNVQLSLPVSHAGHQAAGLRALADLVEAHPDLIPAATNEMAIDFMLTRAPPHPQQLPPKGAQPKLSSLVYAAAPKASIILPCEDSPPEADEAELMGGFVKVSSPMKGLLAKLEGL